MHLLSIRVNEPGVYHASEAAYYPSVQSMKKDRLAPYILVSFLIHAGFFIGAHRFLKLPAEEFVSVELIPVEMVVVREESPVSQPEFAPGDRLGPKKALQTKSRKMMETATDRSAEDMAAPIPKAGVFEPNVTIAGIATTGYIAEAQAAESADSKPLVPASQILPSQISPAVPSAPIETALLEVKIPAVLVEAKAKPTSAGFQASQKVATPLPGKRPGAEPVSDPPALATTSNDEPRMDVAMFPTRSSTPVARNGESVAGKPMILASQIFPSQVSPVYPSEPAESSSSQLEVKIPAVLVNAEAMMTPADSKTPQRVVTPLPGTRPAAEPDFDPPPLATTGNDEPRMNVAMVPTRGFTPVARNGETVAGKPMIPASQMSPWQLSPADPSPPSTSSPLDVRMPAVPIEAKAATIPVYSQSPQKIKKPLASRRPREDLAAEYQPIPREGAYEPVLMVSMLQVQGQPSGAQVYVNGSLIGETPLAWELPLGKYEVRLALPNYYAWDAQVELTPEHKTLPIIYRLVPIEEAQ